MFDDHSFIPLEVQQGISAGSATSCRPRCFFRTHASERHDAQRTFTHGTTSAILNHDRLLRHTATVARRP